MIPKFRAWKTMGTNEMFHNVVAISWNNNKIAVLYPNPGRNTFRIDEESLENVILMQSTVLKDKNGVEIFDGDIVKHEDGELSFIGIVKRDCYRFYIEAIGVDNSYDFEDFSDTCTRTAELTIVGNVYENPELLEVE